ncbi:MAG: hypothetical protein ACOX0F_13790 [Syntrophomonadaceae bacterium]
MALPLLIAKQKNRPILPDDYKLGWLFQDEKEGYWMIWGSCKNKETALSAAKEVLEKQGARDVFISEMPLLKQLTKEQISNFLKVSI